MHGRHRNRLANLTLSGDATSAGTGANGFAAKREVYRKSSVGMTRSLATESAWDEAAPERRVKEPARRTVDRWPRPEQPLRQHAATARGQSGRWRQAASRTFPRQIAFLCMASLYPAARRTP